jgi:amidophosphoribosyltransferase
MAYNKERQEKKMKDKCGVFGIYVADQTIDPAEAAYLGLFAQQHRGQESVGISVSDGKSMKTYKGMGLCTEVFKEGTDHLERLYGGKLSIGHVMYSASGSRELQNAQPLVVSYAGGKLAIAYNGSIVNGEILRKKYEETGAMFQTALDLEVVAYLLTKNYKLGLLESIEKMMKTAKGSYAMVLSTEDTLVAVRDPYGIRPLCLGKVGENYVVASESCAFDTLGTEFVRDVKPGEIIIINENGLQSHETHLAEGSALCIFEFVYFARPDSDIDGISVYTARENMGKILAKKHPVEADVISDVPDSATPAAIGYAEEAGIVFKNALAKNRYVGRTFIKPTQALREQGVKLKLHALKRNVYGKKVVLVDDSIVRGTTSKIIIEMLKKAGAKEVHMGITSPPVAYPCYFGIDTPTYDQLIGSAKMEEEICKMIGADSLHYLTREDLLKTVEGAGCQFCTGCFDGNYPMDVERICKQTEEMSLAALEG